MRSLLGCCPALLAIIGVIGAPVAEVRGQQQAPSTRGSPVNERFLGHFTSSTGEPSIDIEPSDREGEVRVSITGAFGGPGKGDLLGAISADGNLSATGKFEYCTLFGGCSNWASNLKGVITADRLVGTYEFSPLSKPGTIVGDVFEKRPSGTQSGSFDLRKLVPVYTR